MSKPVNELSLKVFVVQEVVELVEEVVVNELFVLSQVNGQRRTRGHFVQVHERPDAFRKHFVGHYCWLHL